MTTHLNLLTKTIAAICLCALCNQQVMAQSEDDGWNHSLAVYLWGASISGTTSDGSGVDVDFKDIVNNLEFGAMGSYQARKGKWSMLADVIYLDVSADKSLPLTPSIGNGNISSEVTANLDLTGWVVHMAGGYNLYDDGEGTTTDVTAGLRYLT